MKNDLQIEKKIFRLNLLLIAITFILNFLGSPLLKYTYLAYATFIFSIALILPFHYSIIYIICFAFLEGQGRILWNYHPLARIIFDLTIAAAILKNVVINRDLNIIKHFNKAIAVLLLLHFTWYFIEAFNPNLPSILAPIAATKIYLFPLILFIFFIKNKELFNEGQLRKISSLILIFSFLECALAIYQQNLKETFMLQISPFYESSMRNGVFTGDFFRPYGTTFLPGAVAPYLFLTFSFIFLRRHLSRKYISLIFCTIVIIAITLLTSQVRSSLAKFILILITIIGSFMVTSRNKIRLIILLTFSLIVVSTILILSRESLTTNYQYLDLSPGIKRWEKINSADDLKAGRAGPIQAIEIIGDKLTRFPLGIGPGVTGAAGSIIQDKIRNNPNIKIENFWGYDNFYISSVIEYGFGAIFYLGFIFSIPIFIISKISQIKRKGDPFKTRVTLIALSNMLIILIGNWMALGLPYNPESFFYWFWAAIGFNIAKDKTS